MNDSHTMDDSANYSPMILDNTLVSFAYFQRGRTCTNSVNHSPCPRLVAHAI